MQVENTTKEKADKISKEVAFSYTVVESALETDIQMRMDRAFKILFDKMFKKN